MIRVAASVAGGLVVLVALAWWSGVRFDPLWWRDGPRTMPPSLPSGALSDVTWQSSFAEHRLPEPAGLTLLGYVARQGLTGHPLSAALQGSCPAVDGFVQGGGLQPVASVNDLSNSSVLPLARQFGWAEDDDADAWFQRPARAGELSTAMALVVTGPQGCTVYLKGSL